MSDLPPALRAALDADVEADRQLSLGPLLFALPNEREKRIRARAMAAALRWAHQGGYESRWHRKRGCENCMAIAALDQEARDE